MSAAVVVGGGISGIAAATHLEARGVSTCIFETSAVLGGRIGCTRDEATGFEAELGGRNFASSDRNLLDLFGSYGVDRFADYTFGSVTVGPGPNFYLTRGGTRSARLKRALGNAAFKTSAIRGVRRVSAVLQEARREGAGEVGTPYWVRLAEATADPAASAHFGPRVADGMLRPWTLRMMASEPEEVYLGNLGNVLGRKPGRSQRVEGGIGNFLRAVAEKLDIRFRHVVRSVIIENGRVIGIEGTADGKPFRHLADIVVVATPAPAAAEILPALPQLASQLRQVTYRAAATAVVEYDEVEFPNGLHGMFTPRGHATSHIARYDDLGRIRFSFAGVAARAMFARLPLAGLIEEGEKTFRRFGGKLGRRISQTAQMWTPGLCAQTWMHHRTVASIFDACKQVQGLVLTGDYFRGNLLDACAGAARENVESALAAMASVDAGLR
jgi:protoporphyrinogen/coproporphyrinogen III oxidase